MQTAVAEKTLQQKLQNFEHFCSCPLIKSGLIFQYDRYISMVRFLHKNYLIIQKRQALLKEKVKYQQGLIAQLKQKYEIMQDKSDRDEQTAMLCWTRIFFMEAPLLKEYYQQIREIRKSQYAVFSPMIARLKVRLQVTAEKEVSDFEGLRREQVIDHQFKAVTKEQLQRIAIARFTQTLQLIEYIEREEKSSDNQLAG